MTITTLSSSSSSSSSSSMRTNHQQQRQQRSLSTGGHVITIPVHASKERHQSALLGQLEHHRNRRLTLINQQQRRQLQMLDDAEKEENEVTRRLLRSSSVSSSSSSSGLLGEDEQSQEHHHPASWRQSHAQTQTQNPDQRQLRQLQNLNDGLITSVDLSNCHLVLYSGQITLGSPPHMQHFRVDFDTAGSDLWIPSALCDSTCYDKHPAWNLYNPSLSKTYEIANASDLSKNSFELLYEDGEGIKGEHAKDTLRLGNDDIRIDRQVFAHVTHIDNFTTCEEEEGILGLANTMTSTHGFPSVLGNLLHKSQSQSQTSSSSSTSSSNTNKVLKHNVFGMYLRSDIDDYSNFKQYVNQDGSTDSTTTSDNDNDNDSVVGTDFSPRTPPQQPNSSSELILGGVNQDHYLGCLKWHDLLGNGSFQEDGSSDTKYDNYWAVQMNDIKVGGTSLISTTSTASDSNDASSNNNNNNNNNNGEDLIAVLDSGSSYIIGPQESVAHLVKLNNAKCFKLSDDTDENKPILVDCDNSDGFDGAILNNCNDPFFSVEFIINNETYVLEKEDFIIHINTLGVGDEAGTEACILRIVASKGMKGWVLGDAFLNKYYSVYDFENQKLGLALAAENVAHDRCDTDLDLDVTNFWESIYDTEIEQENEQNEQEQPVEDIIEDIIDVDDGYDKAEFDADDLEDIFDGEEEADGQDTAENFPSLEGETLDDDVFQQQHEQQQDDTFEFPPPPLTENDNTDLDVDDNNEVIDETTPTQEQIDEWTNDAIEALTEANEKEENMIEQQAEEQFNDMADIDAANSNSSKDDNHNDNNTNSNNNSSATASTSLLDGSHGGSGNANANANANAAPSPSHVPSHFEPPNRESLPAVPSVQGLSPSASNTSSSTNSTSTGGIIGILIATTIILIIIVLLFKRRRKKIHTKQSIKKQQLMFQKTFKNAERQIVNQHRNLNYRDHNNNSSSSANSSKHFQDALDEIKFTGSSGSGGSSSGERFHDEEGGGGGRRGTSTARTSPRSLIGSFSGGVSQSSSSSGDDNDHNNNGQDEVDFVLDSQILQRMN